MTVLVTGASGLLGRTVASSLIDRGDPVRVFQRTPSGLAIRNLPRALRS